jgi:hypothetical protein
VPPQRTQHVWNSSLNTVGEKQGAALLWAGRHGIARLRFLTFPLSSGRATGQGFRFTFLFGEVHLL